MKLFSRERGETTHFLLANNVVAVLSALFSEDVQAIHIRLQLLLIKSRVT